MASKVKHDRPLVNYSSKILIYFAFQKTPLNPIYKKWEEGEDEGGKEEGGGSGGKTN